MKVISSHFRCVTILLRDNFRLVKHSYNHSYTSVQAGLALYYSGLAHREKESWVPVKGNINYLSF
jgi:hypothetical protein